MKNVRQISNVVLLIGAILSFVSAAGLVVAGIVMLILGSPACTNFIVQGVNEGWVHVGANEGTPEEIAVVAQLILIFTGVIMFVCILPVVASGVVALLARNKEKDGLYIASIVLGLVASSNLVIVAGGVLGLIHEEKKEVKEEQL